MIVSSLSILSSNVGSVVKNADVAAGCSCAGDDGGGNGGHLSLST